MVIKNVRTRDDFIQLLQEWYADHIKDRDVYEVADWFIAVQQARITQESMRTKDLANLFLNGIDAIALSPDTHHEEFWATFFEEYDECGDEHDLEEAVMTIGSMLDDFFGIR